MASLVQDALDYAAEQTQQALAALGRDFLYSDAHLAAQFRSKSSEIILAHGDAPETGEPSCAMMQRKSTSEHLDGNNRYESVAIAEQSCCQWACTTAHSFTQCSALPTSCNPPSVFLTLA